MRRRRMHGLRKHPSRYKTCGCKGPCKCGVNKEKSKELLIYKGA